MKRREKIGASEVVFTCLFEPAPEGGFVVTCPALPGLVTEGDTLDEARAMAADAIEGYLESLRKDGLPLPEGERHRTEPIREGVKVKVRA
jgi:antitoxin HicB